MRGAAGEKAFRWATVSALGFLVVFFMGLVLSMFAYVDGRTLLFALFSEEVLFAMRLSFITATLATIFSLAVAIPAAYALSKGHFPGKVIVDGLLDLPIVISPIALGTALLIFFSTPIGDFIDARVLKVVFAKPGIVLAQFTVVSALATRLLKSTFDDIDPRYERVARTLGCSKLEVFFKVTLPLARNGLIAAFVLTWTRAVGEFGATVTLAGATTMRTETLPIAIYLSLASADVGRAVAVTLILIAMALSAMIALRRATGKIYRI